MSKRDRVYQLLDAVPDTRIQNVILYLEDLSLDYLGEPIQPYDNKQVSCNDGKRRERERVPYLI